MWLNLGLRRLSRAPLVVTIHDPCHHVGDRSSSRTPQRVVDIAFRRADEAIVHAPQMRDALLARIPLPAENVHVIPHLRLGKDAAGARVGEEDGLLLFFGRIWPYKGLEYLIRSVPIIEKHVPGVKVIVAGQGEDFDIYRREMTDPARFEVHNRFIPDAEIAEFFSRASVVVLPYTEATQSGVIPVAYTFSKPVVATAVGGLPAQVDDGETGLLVPPRDESALAGAVVRLLEDSELRKRMGNSGRKKLELEWSEEAIAAQTRRVYARALA